MKIVLIGYMGSGKSAIAKDLSKKMNLKFIDLDNYIEDNENLKIGKIFKNKGEIYFRVKENQYLRDILNHQEDIILATGGGTPCYANNMEMIKEKSISVFLKGSIQTLYDRLVDEKEKRPLIQDIPQQDLKEFIAKHLFERNNFYDKADITINIDDKSIADISNEIINQIKK